MDEIIKLVKTYKSQVMLGLGILLLVIWAFCPVIDILGKEEFNGLQTSFGGKGLGFCRFCSFVCLLLPIAYLIISILKFAYGKSFCDICMVSMFVFSVLFAMAIPKGCSLSYGGSIYIFLTIIGVLFHVLVSIHPKVENSKPAPTNIAN